MTRFFYENHLLILFSCFEQHTSNFHSIFMIELSSSLFPRWGLLGFEYTFSEFVYLKFRGLLKDVEALLFPSAR